MNLMEVASMRERINLVKAALQRGGTASGVAVQLACPESVEIAGATGFDFVYIDCEHGSFFLETAVQMIRAAEAAGISPIVRVPNHEPTLIMQALDAGALGVIVPNIATGKQAAASVAAAKYKSGSNGGMRGACPGTRASWHQVTNWPDFVAWSNANTMIWLLIESPEGVERIDEILAVPGIDALMLGPFDLAHALGYPGQTDHPEVTQRYVSLIRKAKMHNVEVVASLFSADPAKIAVEKLKWLELGVRILVAGSDRRMLVNAMRDRAQALRD